jgi:hypothetical protein
MEKIVRTHPKFKIWLQIRNLFFSKLWNELNSKYYFIFSYNILKLILIKNILLKFFINSINKLKLLNKDFNKVKKIIY